MALPMSDYAPKWSPETVMSKIQQAEKALDKARLAEQKLYWKLAGRLPEPMTVEQVDVVTISGKRYACVLFPPCPGVIGQNVRYFDFEQIEYAISRGPSKVFTKPGIENKEFALFRTDDTAHVLTVDSTPEIETWTDELVHLYFDKWIAAQDRVFDAETIVHELKVERNRMREYYMARETAAVTRRREIEAELQKARDLEDRTTKMIRALY